MGTPYIPFKSTCTMMVTAPTGFGKTTWIKRLLTENMFTEKVHSVLYCYSVHQELFNKMIESIPNMELHEGLPSHETLKNMHDGNFHVIVLDDLMADVIKNQEAQKLFTQYSHHYHMTTIFVTQNLFLSSFLVEKM